jgi:hypothetical protein
MKTKTFVIGLFLALCLAISLPAIHEVANTSALQGGYVGPAVEEGSSYYEVGADCVLYHAYWDGTATDHSGNGNDGTVVGATFIENGLSFDGIDDMVTLTISDSLRIGTGDATWYFWFYRDGTSPDGLYTMTMNTGTIWTSISMGSIGYAANKEADLGVYDQEDNRIIHDYRSYPERYPGDPAPEMNTGVWQFIAFCIDRDVGTKVWSSPYKAYSNSKGDIDALVNIGGGTSGNYIAIGSGSYVSGYLYPFDGTIGQALQFNTVKSASDVLDFFNATKARYGVASLDPKYRNHLYAQEKKHEKNSLYRVPRNATVSSAMSGAKRNTSANYRPPIFQDAPRQERARAN